MFCANCGSQKEIDQICGGCNQATESPVTTTTVSTPASVRTPFIGPPLVRVALRFLPAT